MLALVAFGYGTRIYGDLGPLVATGGALLEASFTAGTILWIVFPALCLYELQTSSGAFDTIRTWLSRLSGDPRVLAILIAWFFALVLEGVAGFGTPIALAAPLLVGLGFTPVQAVTLALVGHAAGVSFGALGTPVLPQMAATGLPGIELAWPAALLHALLGWILIAFLMRLASPSTLGGKQVGLGLLAALLFFAPYLILAPISFFLFSSWRAAWSCPFGSSSERCPGLGRCSKVSLGRLSRSITPAPFSSSASSSAGSPRAGRSPT
jgi:lactate permease